MTATVVRFDAELLVHRAARSLGCGGSVVVTEAVGFYGDRTERRLRRCTRESGHSGAHAAPVTKRPTTTDCGLSLDDGAWIDWRASPDDPRCDTCHGVAPEQHDPHEQGALL